MYTELSIIIPVYNVEPYIERCIESVVGQAGRERKYPIEMILVDDGSTDSSGKTADRYAQTYPYIQVIHQKNAGTAAARNTGIERARGKWLYFMDSDDWLAEEGISMLLMAAQKHPGADLILLDAYQDSRDREKAWEHFPYDGIWNNRAGLLKLQRGALYYHMDYPGTRVPLAAPWDKLYNRAFLSKCGIMFREELSVLDDMIFNMEVLGEARRAAYEKYRVYHYRHVASSITNSYKADRVEQDLKVWDYIEWYQTRQVAKMVWGEDDIRAFCQAYYCRIIRSFAICCRIHFYHRDNRKSLEEKQKYVKKVLRSKPYKTAFKKVILRNLEWKLRILVVLVRCRWYNGVYMLHLAETFLSGR